MLLIECVMLCVSVAGEGEGEGALGVEKGGWGQAGGGSVSEGGLG